MTLREAARDLSLELRPGRESVEVVATGPLVHGWTDGGLRLAPPPLETSRHKLQEEVNLLASRLRDRNPEALDIYNASVANHWRNLGMFGVNHAKIVDRFEPWIESVRSSLLGSEKLSADVFETLARVAPAIQIKGSDPDMLPFGLLPLTRRALKGRSEIGSFREVVADATLLPAFLFPITFVPWVAGRSSFWESADAPLSGRQAVMIRSEDTHRWEDLHASLIQDGVLPRDAVVLPTAHVVNDARALASFLVMPHSATTREQHHIPNEVWLYAHGRSGPGYSTSLTIRFEFSERRSWGPGRKRMFTMQTYHLNQAAAARSAQISPDRAPLIVFNVCNSGGEVSGASSAIPTPLTEVGCRVIAPRTRVVEVFASEFGASLSRYLSVLPPSRALLAARWSTLRSTGSPLGLVYEGFGV